MERSHSGLVRRLGKAVYRKVSRVQIPLSPLDNIFYMQNWDTLFKSASTISKQVKTNVVFNCLLWMLPLLVIALIIISPGNNTRIQSFLMWLIGTIIVVILVLFILILVMGLCGKPELFQLLRSEDHVYKMAALEKMGDEKHTVIDAVEISSNTNPSQIDPTTVGIPIPTDLPSVMPKPYG